MNDRFKYRVAIQQKNGSYKRFDVCYATTYDDGKMLVCYKAGNNDCYCWIDCDRAILEQCTGMTDKNGILIYEGDVVVGSWNTRLTVLWDEISVSFMVQPLDSGGAREFHYYSYVNNELCCINFEVCKNEVVE